MKEQKGEGRTQRRGVDGVCSRAHQVVGLLMAAEGARPQEPLPNLRHGAPLLLDFFGSLGGRENQDGNGGKPDTRWFFSSQRANARTESNNGGGGDDQTQRRAWLQRCRRGGLLGFHGGRAPRTTAARMLCSSGIWFMLIKTPNSRQSISG